jgi:hypothetical protein
MGNQASTEVDCSAQMCGASEHVSDEQVVSSAFQGQTDLSSSQHAGYYAEAKDYQGASGNAASPIREWPPSAEEAWRPDEDWGEQSHTASEGRPPDKSLRSAMRTRADPCNTSSVSGPRKKPASRHSGYATSQTDVTSVVVGRDLHIPEVANMPGFDPTNPEHMHMFEEEMKYWAAGAVARQNEQNNRQTVGRLNAHELELASRGMRIQEVRRARRVGWSCALFPSPLHTLSLRAFLLPGREEVLLAF